MGQRNCASWASQPQKSVTLRPQPGGETTKSIRDKWWDWGEKKKEKKNPNNNTLQLVCAALVRLKVRGKVALLHIQELLFFRSLVVKFQI
jgi:hypothetical protein